MSDLEDLQIKSVSEMTEEELHEHLRLVRKRRRVPPQKVAAKTSKRTKKVEATRAPDVEDLSLSQIELILARAKEIAK